MAKSRRESVSREALPLLSLRGAEGDEAISRVRRGEENSAWPGHIKRNPESDARSPKQSQRTNDRKGLEFGNSHLFRV